MKYMLVLVSLMLSLLLAVFSGAFAEDSTTSGVKKALTLKQKQQIEKAKENIQTPLEQVRKKCDLPQLEVAMELDADALTRAEEGNYGVSGFCEYVLSAMKRMCEEDLAKKSIQDGIEKVICRYPGKRALSLEKKTLIFDIDFKAPDNYGYVFDKLENIL